MTNHTELGNLVQYGQLDTLPLLFISSFGGFYFNEIYNKYVLFMYTCSSLSEKKRNARDGNNFFRFFFFFSVITLVFIYSCFVIESNKQFEINKREQSDHFQKIFPLEPYTA